MRIALVLALVCWLSLPAGAADPKLEVLLGKWQLTAGVASIPTGAIFEFQNDSKLIVTAVVGGKEKTFDVKYQLKAKIIEMTVNGMSDVTEVISLDEKELVIKDKDGTTAKFKKLK